MKNRITSARTAAEKSTKVETQHTSSHSNGNTLVVRSPKLSKLTNDEIMAKSKFYSKSAK